VRGLASRSIRRLWGKVGLKLIGISSDWLTEPASEAIAARMAIAVAVVQETCRTALPARLEPNNVYRPNLAQEPWDESKEEHELVNVSKLGSGGDKIQKTLVSADSARFRLYNDLWTMHVVPKTGRPDCPHARRAVRACIANWRQSSHSVFVHPASSHQQLDPKCAHLNPGTEGVYTLNSKLYSAQPALRR
jgi:hypothetical protein